MFPHEKEGHDVVLYIHPNGNIYVIRNGRVRYDQQSINEIAALLKRQMTRYLMIKQRIDDLRKIYSIK